MHLVVAMSQVRVGAPGWHGRHCSPRGARGGGTGPSSSVQVAVWVILLATVLPALPGLSPPTLK